MASNKVCLCDVVGRLDGLITESQVRDRDTAGLLRVILEVCLNEFICVVTDDLDRVLVCTDCAVTAKTPELAGDRACGCCISNNLFGK